MDFLRSSSMSRNYENLSDQKPSMMQRSGSMKGASSPRTPNFDRSGSLRTPRDMLSRFATTMAWGKPELPISEEFCQQIADNEFSGTFVQRHLEFETLVDLLPGSASQQAALLPTDGRKPLSHTQLHYIASIEFPQALDNLGIPEKARIGLVLPNGPEFAVCLIACAATATCAPVNAQNTVEEIVAELRSACATAAIVAGGDTVPASDLQTGLVSALESAGLKTLVLGPCPNTAGLFTLWCPSDPQRPAVTLRGSPPASLGRSSVMPFLGREGLGRNDVAMILHTSGTSGKKKAVTYTVETLVVGASLVMSSWELRMEDVGINMMPLFHVGGIVRNLLAPLLAGSSIVPCRSFDAGQFWDVLESWGVTWYYASPTMHHMILSEGENRKGVQHRIRMIGNAAGGLLPSLAEELRERFNDATVLPSYGMTECMPIASPPANYKLQKPGTSGKVVGPQLRICDPSGNPLTAGNVGNIMVKGAPLFTGYEGDEKATASAFVDDGWFDTGDMGYLDKDKYLYITGRSKEVINRGGEIISPFEIEQAVISHPAINDTIAFSAPHEVLQEVVGVVLVTKPGYPRVDLQELQRYVGDKLHPAKWPVVIVYMDAVPTGAANKVLRVKLAERLSMSNVDDSLPQTLRLFEAICPPKGSPLSVKIPMSPINLKVEIKKAEKVIMDAAGREKLVDAGVGFLRSNVVAYVVPSQEKNWSDQASKALLEMVKGQLNAYVRPKNVIVSGESKSGTRTLPRLPDGSVDAFSISNSSEEPKDTLVNPADLAVASAWSQILGIPVRDIGRDADFFELGGSSLASGKMVALLRKQLGLSLQAGVVFQHRTVGEMGDMITKLLDADSGKSEGKGGASGGVGAGDVESGFERVFEDDEAEVAACRPKSSTSFAALFLQILPLAVFYPVTRVSLWFLFIYYLSLLRQNWTLTYGIEKKEMQEWELSPVLGIPQLIIAIIMVRVTADIVQPLIGIAMKWIIIGRYKPGRYPFWGQYYLRWFLVKSILKVCHIGMFTWLPNGKIWYYRLLGAKIGMNVRFHDRIKLGEYDLLNIGDDTMIDNAMLRPFCLDRGSMLLRPITIGKNCVICQKTTISAGTTMPDDTCLPPCSSSYEMFDADPKYRDYCRVGFPSPHWAMMLFIGYPILLLGTFTYVLPWIGCLFLYVSLPQFLHAETPTDLIKWFGTDERLPLFLMLKVVRDCVCPVFYLIFAILIKRNVLGRFKVGSRDKTQWNLLRYWLMKRMMPGRDLGGVAKLVGPNFGVISFLYRLLGAKVGRHVYWPGSGVYVEEFDLLEIGDDVVFGSRSEILCCDAKSAAPVKLESGCMVADRCVILPGVTVGRNATLGSGTLAARGMNFPPGSTWVGSSKGNATLWDEGKGVDENASTATPYARAMFERKAKGYIPWPMWFHVIFAACMSFVVSVYHGIPILMILALTVRWAAPWLHDATGLTASLNLLHVYGVMLGIGILSIVLVTVTALLIIIIAKWLVIGRRREGKYKWDESSYNQRWQIMRRIEGLRSTGISGKGPLDFLLGSAYLVWYFRALGCNIGKNVCLYPNSGDPMMTEPELVTIEDEAAVDDASLVAHINSRGEFALNRLRVGRGATLRSNSRLLSGASMEEHSMLLEHTLVLSGDVVDADSVWQGWPARMIRGPPASSTDNGKVALYAGH